MKQSASIEPRSQGGFSLVTVMVIGMISTLWVSALFTAVLPGYQRVAHLRQQHVLRASAEAALDWTVSQLNATPDSTLDDPTNNGQPAAPALVPPTAIGSYGIPVSVTVQVNNIPAPQSSYMWDPLLDPTNPQGAGLNGQQLWRVVTATASISGSTSTKTVRVILRPTPTASQGDSPIDGAMFARDTYFGSGASLMDAYDSGDGSYGGSNARRMGGGIGSNTSVTLAGNQEIYGNVQVTSAAGTEQSNVVMGMNNVTVRGGVLSNGQADDFYDSHTLGQGLPSGSPPVQEGIQKPQKQLPAVPNPPATANTLSPINLAGSASQTLAAGDYIVPSIRIMNTASLNTSGRVRIWVQGTSPQITVTSPQGIANTTGVPANLQVYFSGTTAINLSGSSDYKGVLYAPNATVNLGTSGNIYGSIIAHRISQTGNGAIHYDIALGRANIFTTQVLMVPRWRTVSWQEI